VLAFVAYNRNATLAGTLLGAWGAGAMIGGVVAFRLVRSHGGLRLGAFAWSLQALPLWILVATPAPAIAVAALIVSGIGNGVRVPPIVGVTTRRIPHAIRAETLTVSSALVLTGGFVALLLAAPTLDAFGPEAVFAGIAAAQTLAAVLVLRLAFRVSASARPPLDGGF
jgi:predicted MFS family arabinose efflux permease